MRHIRILFIYIILSSFSNHAFSTSLDAIGYYNEDTTWDVDTVKLIGDLTIQDGARLTITPGTRIESYGMYKIITYGSIIALGTAQDSILFTSADTTDFYTTSLDDGGWRGLFFNMITDANDSTLLSHCIVEFTKKGSTGGSPLSAIQIDLSDRIRISNCTIRHNYYNSGGAAGIRLFSAAPLIIDNYFTKNSGDQGGAMGISGGSEAIVHNNIFYDNFARRAGGAIICQESNPVISNNYICNNRTEADNCGPADGGGGIRCTGASTPNIANNVIANNTTGMKGGGIDCLYGANPTIENNTIVHNNGDSGGGGIYMFESSPVITNNIIWGNTRFNNEMTNQLFMFTDDSDPSIINSCLEGDSTAFMFATDVTYTGVYQNNINLDPQFVSPSLGSGVDFDGLNADWQLLEGSPCIDAGTNSVNPSLPQIDISGSPRFNGIIDMGAFEVKPDNLDVTEIKSEIHVYPNPVSSQVTIASNVNINELSLINATGQIIKSYYINNMKTTLKLDNLAEGIYFIKVNSIEGGTTHKIIKQ